MIPKEDQSSYHGELGDQADDSSHWRERNLRRILDVNVVLREELTKLVYPKNRSSALIVELSYQVDTLVLRDSKRVLQNVSTTHGFPHRQKTYSLPPTPFPVL